MSREKHDVELDDVALSADQVDENIDVAAAESDPDIEPDSMNSNSISADELDVDQETDLLDPVQVAEQDFSRWLSEIATGTETDPLATQRAHTIPLGPPHTFDDPIARSAGPARQYQDG